MGTNQQSNQLREYLWLLRRRKWEIILVAAATFAAAIVITLRQTPVYEGATKVLVNTVQDPNSGGGPVTVDLPTEQQVATSSGVAAAVIKKQHLSTSPSSLTGNLNVAPVAGTASVLSIAYDSPSPSVAARLANAFAAAYVRFRSNEIARSYRSAMATASANSAQAHAAIQVLDRRIVLARTPAERSSLQARRDTLVAQLGVIQQEISTLQTGAASNQSNAAVVIQSAAIPGSPIRPQKVRNGILALVVGLFLGILLALFRHRLDIRFRSLREFEEVLGAPLLGAIPHVSGWHTPRDSLVLVSDPHAPVAEIFRTLATNLRFTAREQGVKVVLITSALQEEGKSTVSANLAIALAQAGQRVLLVSADLRRPRLHRLFDVPNEGITEVVAGSKTLTEVLQDPDVPELRLLGSGSTPADPAAVLGSRRAAELFEDLRSVACDFILVEAPPVLAVADASIVAPYTDGVVYVVNARQTTQSAVEHAKAQLKNSGARIIGGVYNNFDAGSDFPGGYYQSRNYRRSAPSEEHAENGNSATPVPSIRFSR